MSAPPSLVVVTPLARRGGGGCGEECEEPVKWSLCLNMALVGQKRKLDFDELLDDEQPSQQRPPANGYYADDFGVVQPPRRRARIDTGGEHW